MLFWIESNNHPLSMPSCFTIKLQNEFVLVEVRTQDLSLIRGPLYQLSYKNINFAEIMFNLYVIFEIAV